MNVTEVVDRLGAPESVGWDDPVLLTYGACDVRVPRDGSYLMVVGPDLDAILALLQRPVPTQLPAEPPAEPTAETPVAPPPEAEVIPPPEPEAEAPPLA